MARQSPAQPSSWYRRLPISLQWGVPLGTALIVVALVVGLVRHEQGSYGAEASVSASKIKAEDQQADAVMRQQQAPHLVKVSSAQRPAKALAGAITAWVDDQTKSGAMNGPVSGARCTPSGNRSGSATVALKCTVSAAQVSYDFLGVVDRRAGTATYCQKIAYSPVYGQPTLPVSTACTTP